MYDDPLRYRFAGVWDGPTEQFYVGNMEKEALNPKP